MGERVNDIIKASDDLMQKALGKLQGSSEQNKKVEKVIDISECIKSISEYSVSYNGENELGDVIYNKLKSLFSNVDNEDIQNLRNEMFTSKILDRLSVCLSYVDVAVLREMDSLTIKADKFNYVMLKIELAVDRNLDSIDLDEYSVHSNAKNYILYQKDRKEYLLNVLSNELSNVLDNGYITSDYGIDYGIYDDLKFKNCSIHSSIVLRNKNSTVHFSGSCSVKSELPIRCYGEVTIIGEDNAVLRLESTSDMQPCIGTRTNTGLSDGRWEPSYYELKSITLDNIEVYVDSKNNSFSLGSYGDANNEIPELTIINGSRIDCPETRGTRLIQYQANPPEGSTKIYGLMKYIIVGEGQSPNDFIPEDVLALLKELPDCAMDYASYKTTKNDVKNAIKVYKLNPALQWYKLLENNCKNVYKCEQVILKFDPIEYFDSEASFEVYKSNYLSKSFFSSLKSKIIIPAVYLIKLLEENVQYKSEYIKEVMYEMIPAYSFTFDREESHYDAARRFLAENETKISPVVLKSVDVRKLLDKYS